MTLIVFLNKNKESEEVVEEEMYVYVLCIYVERERDSVGDLACLLPNPGLVLALLCFFFFKNFGWCFVFLEFYVIFKVF